MVTVSRKGSASELALSYPWAALCALFAIMFSSHTSGDKKGFPQSLLGDVLDEVVMGGVSWAMSPV